MIHFVMLNFILDGVQLHGLKLRGVNDDELEKLRKQEENTHSTTTASSLSTIIRANLDVFNSFTGTLEFDYKGALEMHFAKSTALSQEDNGGDGEDGN